MQLESKSSLKTCIKCIQVVWAELTEPPDRILFMNDKPLFNEQAPLRYAHPLRPNLVPGTRLCRVRRKVEAWPALKYQSQELVELYKVSLLWHSWLLPLTTCIDGPQKTYFSHLLFHSSAPFQLGGILIREGHSPCCTSNQSNLPTSPLFFHNSPWCHLGECTKHGFVTMQH